MSAAITVARGDGIGPEITDAVLRVLESAGASLDVSYVDIGERLYLAGESTGIADSTWETLHRTGVMLKGPITTPFGGGYKSLNVTLRKRLGLAANVRPVRAYSPYVETLHPEMDVVVIRENEEDLYAGIEYQQTEDTVQAIKIITRPGCERICRYAMDYARAAGRKKVTCMIKDNIMKQTDGLFWRVCQEVSEDYPEIELDRMIVDIGMAKVAVHPEWFDVIVTENLYGDIVSDITAELSGSVGLGGSANVGERFAMFEAIHGSAPDIAGQDLANPSGLLAAAVMMLVHLGRGAVAERVHNAWLTTLEDGIHTGDVAGARTVERVGTSGFADAVIARLGRSPARFAAVSYPDDAPAARVLPVSAAADVDRVLVGVDVTVRHLDDPAALGEALEDVSERLSISSISARGVLVWPGVDEATTASDSLRCRFSRVDERLSASDIAHAQLAMSRLGLEIVSTEHLYEFDGVRAFSLAQGE